MVVKILRLPSRICNIFRLGVRREKLWHGIRDGSTISHLGSFNSYVDNNLSFFGHLPTSTWTFFNLNLGQKQTFFDPLPISSCPHSFWTTHLSKPQKTHTRLGPKDHVKKSRQKKESAICTVDHFLEKKKWFGYFWQFYVLEKWTLWKDLWFGFEFRNLLAWQWIQAVYIFFGPMCFWPFCMIRHSYLLTKHQKIVG